MINRAESAIAQATPQLLVNTGKVTNVPLIAVVNKLLRQEYAVVKFDEDYDPNYQPIYA